MKGQRKDEGYTMSKWDEAKAKLLYYGIDVNYEHYTGEYAAVKRIVEIGDQLQSENERLREALKQISLCEYAEPAAPVYMKRVANKALGYSTEPSKESSDD